jgi:hypothetical protein
LRLGLIEFDFASCSRVRNATARKFFAAGRGLLPLQSHRSRKLNGPRRLLISAGSAVVRRFLEVRHHQTTRSIFMLFLSYAYRFLSNFVFLALVYFALNFLEKYQHRVVVAVLVLVYAGMHAASALRSFHFFQRIERLELEARRLVAALGEGPNSTSTRKQVITDVSALRQAGEIKAYIDILFLAIVILLCVAKIVTN